MREKDVLLPLPVIEGDVMNLKDALKKAFMKRPGVSSWTSVPRPDKNGILKIRVGLHAVVEPKVAKKQYSNELNEDEIRIIEDEAQENLMQSMSPEEYAEELGLPRSVAGVEIEYFFEGKVRLLDWNLKVPVRYFVDPVIGGIQIEGYDKITTSTLGTFVKDLTTGDIVLLTSRHTVTWSLDDDVVYPDAEVYQPLWFYSPPIGRILRMTSVDTGVSDNLDGAVCEVFWERGRDIWPEYFLSLGYVPSKEGVAVQPNDIVVKVGMKTGKTESQCVETGVNINVNVNRRDGSTSAVSYLADSYLLDYGGQTFSESGDSGALVMKKDTYEPVGIYFTAGATYGYAVPAVQLMSALNISFVLVPRPSASVQQVQNVIRIGGV